MIHNVKRKVIRPSRPDPGPGPAGELGVLFDRSPIAMVVSDRELLALYTDGLIEQPGQDIGTGMSRLAPALASGPAPSLDQLCDSVLASLAPHPRDHITLPLARTTAQTAR